MKKSGDETKPRGRPRNFDRGEALSAAMLQFWQHGFEATSIADLSAAMGLNPPSIYGAFGDKKALFEQSIDAYVKGPGCFAERAMTEETDTRKAIARLLNDAAATFTSGEHPPGCMVVLSALNCTDEASDVKQSLAERRNASANEIKERLLAAKSSGELPPHISADSFANLVVTVFQGLSIRARDGATREELEGVVAEMMMLWPERDR
jgi:TetR/AcrR family transcriptional regulator, copper-responsive repressor